jgi:tetratricopeptide (TPR) repeat protein
MAAATLSQAPPTPLAWRLQVRALLAAGRPAEALAPLGKLLDCCPDPEACALAGEVYEALGAGAEAAWWYARALAAQPEDQVLARALRRVADKWPVWQGAELARQAAAWLPDAQARSRAHAAVCQALQARLPTP